MVVMALESWREAVSTAHDQALPVLQSFTPLGHSTDEATLRLIARLVLVAAPRHVIEFGCGPATELLALLGFEHGRMAVTTFEHDPWAAQELMLHSSPFAINYRWFSFCICPWVLRRCGPAVQPIYDDGMTTSTVPFPADVIVIKPVPALLGGRGGLIYQALKYARPGTIVLIDSAGEEEASLTDIWTRQLPEHYVAAPRHHLPHAALIVRASLPDPYQLELPGGQRRP
jgi:hypothetical protein